MDAEQGSLILQNADLIYDEIYCQEKLVQIADEISHVLHNSFPLVLCIMGGAVVFTGRLLPLLFFPLEFDYIHVTRYQKELSGGQFKWFKCPGEEVIQQRTVLILDDILDEGHTLFEAKSRVLELGAKKCYTAVFAQKDLAIQKLIQADFVGLNVPNRYVFGYGMDVKGYWRNLPAIYALKE
ncbi:MAG: hypoxanthine-guanine phosphoribosyltransferase [Neisseriaceae bacterium]|nr:MAG: hypoxanthine-guanine phosphoribosyltransferase [Neisseriaceae bacterium]